MDGLLAQLHQVAGLGSLPIRWGEHESFPIGWCGKRIINCDEDNVWSKFRILLLDDGKDAMTFSPDGGDRGGAE